MDEPMEADAGHPADSQDDRKPRVPGILRPGSMVMMTITAEDYEKQYWPKLENAINQLLTMAPSDYIPISYEQMYSCVYKCVCKQFSERLYNDLLHQMTTHLERLCRELQVGTQRMCRQLQGPDANAYIERFNFALNQYLQALAGIVPIFNYMNRFYVESKLKTDLYVELRKLFVIYVAEKHIQSLIPLLVEANSKPFSVSPQVMANLIKNLHCLNPDFAKLRPHLFAKYIPNILPPCSEAELEKYQQEAWQMQRDLKTHPEFISGDQSRKRRGEDDAPKMTSLSYLPKNYSS